MSKPLVLAAPAPERAVSTRKDAAAAPRREPAGEAGQGDDSAQGELVDRIIAVVNDEVITLGELDRAVALQRARSLPGLGVSCGEGPLPVTTTHERTTDDVDPVEPHGTTGDGPEVHGAGSEDTGIRDPAPGQGEDPGLRRRVLECLIDAKLVFQHVRRFPESSHPPGQVDEAYHRLVERYDSPEAFQQELHRWNLSVKDVRRDLERQLMVRTYIDNRFRGFVDVSEFEIREYYEEELVPALQQRGARVPPLERVEEEIRRLLHQRQVNRRIESWVGDLKRRARITRYLW